jgi:biopolymer transport protein ExbD
VHGKQVGPERLKQVLAAEAKRQADAAVVIVADRAAQVGRAVEVMDVCMQAGVKRVSVAAQKK